MDGGEVHAFVKVPLAGRPLAETHVTEGPLPFPFQGQPDTRRLGELGADGTRANHDAAAAAAEVARCLASATRGIGCPGERREHEFFGREAAGQGGGKIPIVKAETIAAWFQRRDSRHLGDLMPAGGNNKGQLSGAVQNEAPVVQRPGPKHRAIGLENTPGGQSVSFGQPTNSSARGTS